MILFLWVPPWVANNGYDDRPRPAYRRKSRRPRPPREVLPIPYPLERP